MANMSQCSVPAWVLTLNISFEYIFVIIFVTLHLHNPSGHNIFIRRILEQ